MLRGSARGVSTAWLAFLVPALLALFFFPLLAGENPNIRFRRLSQEDGLSQEAINCILQDRRGFMWFGTQEGLNRYDGHRFTSFRNEVGDPTSLSHDWVWALHEDGQGIIWVGTDGGGLDRFDPATETFSHFRHDPADPRTLSSDRVRVISEDRQGRLWIGTYADGLSLFHPESGAFTHLRHEPTDPRSLSDDHIRCLLAGENGTLWVGTDGGGLCRLDALSASFATFRHQPEIPTSLAEDHVRSLFQDRDGSLWIGTYGGGVDRLDPSSGHFTHFPHRPEDPASLGSGRVRCVYQTADGEIWAATDDGLSRWRPPERRCVTYRFDATDRHSLSDNRVISLYQDRGSVLWVGTFGGLNRWNVTAGTFAHLKQEAGVPSGLSSNVVTSFAEDREGGLWIGTYGGGVNRYDETSGEFQHFAHRIEDPASLADDRVMSLLLDRAGTLWVGTFDGGLDRLDRGSRAFSHFRHDPANPGGLSADGVTEIFEDRQGLLWIGTYGGGLNRLDPLTGRFSVWRHDESDPASLGSDRVLALCEDHAGVLWVGTEGGGLNRFDRESNRCVRFRHDPTDPRSLSSDVAWALFEDRQGVFWIGTQGGGLNRWDPADREAGRNVFRHYGIAEGLPSSVVYGILEDGEGRLWLSTNRGLSRFSPAGESFKNFDTTQGLQSSEFNFGAYHQCADGRMLFGGSNGLNIFHPDQIRGNPHVPSVVFTSFLKMNKPFDLGRAVWDQPEIKLGHRDDLVSFEFAALDFTAPEKNLYQYKMEGLDDDWIDLGVMRQATFTTLRPGSYTLRVIGSNNDGVWNEQGASIRVRMVPAPWRTWWAYGLYSLLLALLAGGVHVSRLRSIRAKKSAAEQALQESRTLQTQIEASLREKETLLREIHHRVKNNLQVIYSLLDLQDERLVTAEAREIFEVTKDRIQSMALVHEQLYQSEDMARIDFAEYIGSLVVNLQHSFGIDRQRVSVRARADGVSLDLEQAIPVSLILNELISNSFKYAFPEGRRGVIDIALLREDGRHTLIVSDDGVGMPPGLDFRNCDSMGMQLVNILTEQLAGTVVLERTVGTRFRITF